MLNQSHQFTTRYYEAACHAYYKYFSLPEPASPVTIKQPQELPAMDRRRKMEQDFLSLQVISPYSFCNPWRITPILTILLIAYNHFKHYVPLQLQYPQLTISLTTDQLASRSLRSTLSQAIHSPYLYTSNSNPRPCLPVELPIQAEKTKGNIFRDKSRVGLIPIISSHP